MSSISKVSPIIDPTRGEDAWAAWDEAKGRQAFPKGKGSTRRASEMESFDRDFGALFVIPSIPVRGG